MECLSYINARHGRVANFVVVDALVLLVLESYCFIIGLKLFCFWIGIVLILDWYCFDFGLVLFCSWIGIVFFFWI